MLTLQTLLKPLKRVMAVLDDLLFPEKLGCLLCDELSHGEWLCEDCVKRLAAVRRKKQHAGLYSAYWYDGAAKQLVHTLKFDAVRGAATVLAEAMAEEATKFDMPADTVVTWVTMPTRRRLARGIDHGRELAQEVATRLGLQTRQLLVRLGKAKNQRRLKAEARQKNLLGVFGATGKLSGTVLLVDDVYTTGATMRVCSEVLRQAGAERVIALTATCVANCFKTEENDTDEREAE